MPILLRVRTILFALAIALGAASSHALQLGESEAQVTARHGIPAVEDHARHLAMYYWDGWSAQLEFKEGTVARLTYHRNTYIEDGEIQSLLQANGGLKSWTEMTPPAAATRLWTRTGGAQATCDRVHPMMMTFQTAAMATPGATPAEAIVADSFLKFAAPDEAIPQVIPNAVPETPLNEITVPTPALRSQAELRPDDAESAPAVTPPAVAPGQVQKVNLPPAPQPQASAPAKRSNAVYAILIGIGLAISAAAFVFKKRATTTPSVPTPAAAHETSQNPTATVASTAPELDLLDQDQSELLVGEIFRRAGFKVELSAALGAEGRLDLVLRRDGECIPVQCKHWKSARVSAEEVREFYAAMADTGAPRGILVTTGNFTGDAREFAMRHAIELIDRRALEQRIAGAQRPGENFCDVSGWVGDFTAHARIFDPECPCCGGAMVIRHHRTEGTASWACASYPRCAGKRDPRRDLMHLHAAA